LTEGKIGVLSVSSLFLTQPGRWECMRVYACVYAHTHTHCTDGVLDVSPRVGMRHLEGPKNTDGLILAHIYLYMCTKYTCVYICQEAG